MRPTGLRLACGAAAAVLIAAACGDGDVAGVPPDAVRVPDRQVDTLVSEHYTGVDSRRRQVIRSRDAWEAFWREVYAGRSPTPAPPPVDFEADMVLALGMGERSTGGYTIGVDGLHRADSGLFVEVRETSPGPSCVVPMAFTAPVLALRVPRVEGEVAFVEHQSERDCS